MRKMTGQRGYFLLIAVILIVVMGTLGSALTYMFSVSSSLSVPQKNAMNTFYLAESGVEIGTRLLTAPSLSTRLSCAGITGTASVTNSSLNGGTFTLSVPSSTYTYHDNLLSGAITSSATTISVSDITGFADSGRIMIDHEAIDYAGTSGNSFIGVTRAAGGTTASSHASSASVGQFQCDLKSAAGIPSIASPSYQRQINWSVQLQDAWAVSSVSSSTEHLVHWNYPTEEAWNLSTVSRNATLNGVSLLSNGDGWAVGDVTSNTFTFLRWNGSSWTLNAVAGACSTQDLESISMVSSQQGWAVGAAYRPACASSGSIWRYNFLYWNGSGWSVLTPSTSPSIPADTSSSRTLNSVHVIDTNGDGLGNVGFAVGNNGIIFRYNGTNWVTITSPTTRNLFGVFTVSASEAWAVGANGTIIRWNGSTWSTFSSPLSQQLNSIYMLDTDGDGLANYGIAVANNGRYVIYNGSSWSSGNMGGSNLLGVALFNAKDAWAVGASGTARHWDGSTWTSVTSGTSRSLNAISIVNLTKSPASNWQQIFR